jgi:uncharacterized protein
MTHRAHRIAPAFWAALALSCTGIPATAGSEPLRLATGGVSGIYHAFGSALCRLLEPDLRQRLDRCLVLSTEGSLDNLHLLRSGEVEVGIAQGSLVEEAVAGAGAFAAMGPYDDLRVLFAPLKESLAVMVRADDAMEGLEDLAGRRIDAGPPGSGSRAAVERLLAAADLDQAPLFVPDPPPGALPADLLCAGASDAIAVLGAHPHAIVQEALVGCETQLLPLDRPALDRFLAAQPDYRPAEIGPGQYVQLEAAVATIGSPAFVVADAALADATAYRLTATVFTQLDELRRLHLSFAGLDRAALVGACPPAPYHPGALAYFAEAGVELPRCP